SCGTLQYGLGLVEQQHSQPQPMPTGDVESEATLRLGDSVSTVPATTQELELRAEVVALHAQLDAMQASKSEERDHPPVPIKRIPPSLCLDNAIFHAEPEREHPDNQLGMSQSTFAPAREESQPLERAEAAEVPAESAMAKVPVEALESAKGQETVEAPVGESAKEAPVQAPVEESAKATPVAEEVEESTKDNAPMEVEESLKDKAPVEVEASALAKPEAPAEDPKVTELKRQLREMEDRMIALQGEKSKGAPSSSSGGPPLAAPPVDPSLSLEQTLDGAPLGDDDLDAELKNLIQQTSSDQQGSGRADSGDANDQPDLRDSKITFLSHKNEGMRLNRFMESSEGAKYPHTQKLFNGTHEEKRQLLRRWVENGGDKKNVKDVEASVVMSKSSATKVKGRMECLSVLEMKRRGWPRNKILACVQKGGGIKDEHCPDDPLLTSYWSITERSKTDTEVTKVEGQVRVGCDAAGAIGAVTSAATVNALR
ncbi:unnamed protein product, partial [Durusdinium trenchii]